MEKKGANGLYYGTAFSKLNKNLYSFLSDLALINLCTIALDTDEMFDPIQQRRVSVHENLLQMGCQWHVCCSTSAIGLSSISKGRREEVNRETGFLLKGIKFK
jgi:hypothetical protein